MTCPKCGDSLWTDKNEPYCLCGWHDWDRLDFKQEVFWGVHYQGQATKRDGATRDIWSYNYPILKPGTGHPKGEISIYIPLTIEYLEVQRGKSKSALCMYIEGWPDERWSRYNANVHERIRRAFREEIGLNLKGLEDALGADLRATTKTS